MGRSYYSCDIKAFLEQDERFILGELVKQNQFSLEEQQRNAWIKQIRILKDQLVDHGRGHIIFEYSIPRMGRRVDVIVIIDSVVFIIEFKVNEKEYPSYAIDQVMDYAVDLKNFQEGSHDCTLMPILICTEAEEKIYRHSKYLDAIYKPALINKKGLSKIIFETLILEDGQRIEPQGWENSIYKPTPTIIQAAQALYQGHSVKEISRSDSGAINLGKTTEAINEVIEDSKKNRKKSICFVTGVPGAGKTLAGLNIANQRHQFIEEEHAVFLSGNGPLVDVLQEALARNEVENKDKTVSKSEALRKSKAFIQNIHHFRDDAISKKEAPIEKVVVFDEAQRAWTLKQTADFMRRKKGIDEFNYSEPEFLISVMDRHEDWAVIICLVGGGQEINTGEAGIFEWFSAIHKYFKHWNVYVSTELTDVEYTRKTQIYEAFNDKQLTSVPELHLNTSLRSFRSENVSNLIKALLDCETGLAKDIHFELSSKYPIKITRELNLAKKWLRENARGTERIGLLASSGAYRLKPCGINVQAKIKAVNWFLNPKDDVRSSFFLEDAATEFDVQGLELDWTCVSWDADLRFINDKWEYKKFVGTKWQNISDEERVLYLKNTYRVLLTRARQGMVIFIPEGDPNDITRLEAYYNGTYNYLKNIGFEELK